VYSCLCCKLTYSPSDISLGVVWQFYFYFFLRRFHTVFDSGFIYLHSHQLCMRASSTKFYKRKVNGVEIVGWYMTNDLNSKYCLVFGPLSLTNWEGKFNYLSKYRLNLTNLKIQNMKCFRIWNFFHANIMSQVENSIPDLIFKMQVH
jgi:hypothetical protein